MKQTGAMLKKAREEKGLSLAEVGFALKLNSKVLKAIEEGDDKNLPAKTFIRGFVKSYAAFLRLDVDLVLKCFFEEYGSTKPQPYLKPTLKVEMTESNPDSVQKEDAKEKNEPTSAAELKSDVNVEVKLDPEKEIQQEPVSSVEKNQTSKNDEYNPLKEKKSSKTFTLVSISIVLVGLILFTKKMVDKYSKEAEILSPPTSEVLPVNSSPNLESRPGIPSELSPVQLAGPVSLSNNPPSQSGPTDASLTKKPGQMNLPGATPNSQNKAPNATLAPAATSSPAPQTSGSATNPEANSSSSAATAAAAQDEKNKPLELIVEALDAVEIEYAAPNGKTQKIKLTADQVHTFKSRRGLKINFSNGGAVNLIKNGKDLGIPGDLGKPLGLSY